MQISCNVGKSTKNPALIFGFFYVTAYSGVFYIYQVNNNDMLFFEVISILARYVRELHQDLWNKFIESTVNTHKGVGKYLPYLRSI